MKQVKLLPLEMQATANALRHVYDQVNFLVRSDDAMADHGSAWLILADSERLADALEEMAGRICET
jgi:hypothetical protein